MEKKDNGGPSGPKPDKDESLSHKELLDKLDTYSQTNLDESAKDYFKHQRMKDKYLKRIDQEDVNKSKGSVYYGQGIKAGLPHPDYSKVEENHTIYNQKLRDETAKEAKDYYDQNHSLKKEFVPEASKHSRQDPTDKELNKDI